MERVVFRIEKNQYDNAREHYLAVFPDDPANPGRYACVPFFFNGGRAVFEPYCECDRRYYLKTKRVPKNTPVAERCLMAVEDYYNAEFKLCEKIMV